MKKRCYRELSRLKTFEERFAYLKVMGTVGNATFGSRRDLNQIFYHSPEWIKVRGEVIIRDNACDLGLEGYDLSDLAPIYIHHMNPITLEQILDRDPSILDPEYLVCCSFETHNAIHYSDEALLTKGLVERRPGDTKLW